ncbi:MAG: sigma-70 family RNA polymerase sigma factor [Desulfohalobiaceae bacterium]
MNFSVSDISQKELFELCSQGDERAWEWVYNYVLSISRWPRWNIRFRSEDMAQSIVLFLLEEGLQKVERPESFKFFIKKVAVSKILDSYKSKENKYESDGFEDVYSMIDYSRSHTAQSASVSEETVINKDFIRIVNQELMNLPPYCQKVLPQYFYMKIGLIENYKELAEKIGDSIGVVSSRVSRCLKKLVNSESIKKYFRS